MLWRKRSRRFANAIRVSGASRSGHVSLTPKASLNTTPRTQQDPISFTGNNPDPKPSNNTFGGGIGVNFPF